jgi:hypothetical protein
MISSALSSDGTPAATQMPSIGVPSDASVQLQMRSRSDG